MNRALVAFAAVASLVSGCATLPRTDDFGSERRDEQHHSSRSEEAGLTRRDEQTTRIATTQGTTVRTAASAVRR
jgi:hypothetical protein